MHVYEIGNSQFRHRILRILYCLLFDMREWDRLFKSRFSYLVSLHPGHNIKLRTGGCAATTLQHTTIIIVAYCTGLLEIFMLHKLKRYLQVALVYEGLLLLLITICGC